MVFDCALEAGDADDFAYVVLVLNEDEDAIEHVLEDALGAEADRDAQNSGRSKQRLVGDAEQVEDLEEELDEAEDSMEEARMMAAMVRSWAARWKLYC